MGNLLFIDLRRNEMLYMLSKYAHVKGFDLSNSLICYSIVFFNPLTYALYPLTGYLPPNKIPQPPNKKIVRAPRDS